MRFLNTFLSKYKKHSRVDKVYTILNFFFVVGSANIKDSEEI